MKVTLEFDLEIDGKLDEKRVADILAEHLEPVNAILTSDDIDGTDEWAIIINGWEVVLP